MNRPRIRVTSMISEVTLPSLIRYPQYKGAVPEYRLYPREVDMLPLDTFLVATQVGFGGYPATVGRVVKPNDPTKKEYRGFLTPDKRLVYQFWAAGSAVKMLQRMSRNGSSATEHLDYTHVVLPGMKGYVELEGFKIMCDTRRSHASSKVAVSSALLCRAIDWPEGKPQLF